MKHRAQIQSSHYYQRTELHALMRWYKCFTKTFASDFCFVMEAEETVSSPSSHFLRLRLETLGCQCSFVCLFELKAAGGEEDVKEDKVWLLIWPTPPAPSHPSHPCITASCDCRHQIKPLYYPSHTETGKLPSEPTAELFAAGGGGAQFAATKATWDLFLSTKRENRTELLCQ